ncbi:MAG: hypothetical protein IJM27_12575 [Eubacterium sp.]|nr:hypothetical protein [Eubacterium sp.]
MLSREEFADAIMDELRYRLPSEYTISRQTVLKDNDRPYTALTVTEEGSEVGMVLYAENLYGDYERGMPLEEVAENAVHNLEQNAPDRGSLPSLDRAYILDHVYYRMANAGMNQKRFEDVPFRTAPGAEDIALYPCVDVEVGGHHGRILVKNGQIESLGITKDELHEAAEINTERRVEIVPLSQVLQELMPGMPMEEMDNPLYVTRDREAHGCSGASLFGAPKVLSQMEDDFYIIPSSVHEVLLLPKELETDTDHLHMMVHEVNRDVLQPEDFLSDHVYETKAGAISTVEREKTAELEIG